jgi:hypothetical protein
VDDPIEVDEKSLKADGPMRVKVACKDATKMEGTTLLYINREGHLIRWWSEKGVKEKLGASTKSSKFDRHKDESNEEGDKADSTASHDSVFTRLGKEQEEEEKGRMKLGKAVGDS